jgi:hypothetical protein
LHLIASLIAQVEADLKGSYTGLEAQRLGTLVAEREAQLVALVRELYGLAAAERVPGVVAHEARARVFRRCDWLRLIASDEL